MSRRSLSLALALPFTLITTLALREGGLAGFYHHHQSWGGLQVFVDLVIIALLACGWMIRDAGHRGIRAWPFVLLTLAAGSFGPLAYLALATSKSADPAAPSKAEGPDPLPYWAPILLSLVAVAFAVLTGKALLVHGYLGIWSLQFASWASRQVLADLAILCLFFCQWMISDARRSGRSPWPYLLLTLGAGSFGPLAYLLVGSWRTPRQC